MDKSPNNKAKNKSAATGNLPATKNKGTEKRRNNEKRKEKSRDAARCRRSRETEIFTDLAGVLPVRREDVEQLDKASVMRLSIAYLKVRNMMEFFPQIKSDSSITNKTDTDEETNIEHLITQAMDGFMLVLSTEGDIIYVSENVSDYLGIHQIDMIGQQLWDYSHQCDHAELREVLKERKNGSDDGDGKSIHRDFLMRLKCTLTSRGRNVNIKSASYKVIHITGHTTVQNQGNRLLVAIGRPVPHPSNIEVPLDSSTFLTKHSLDMKFSYVDDKMSSLLGYQPEHLMNKSLYDYHHSGDSESLMGSFKNVISKGQAETCRYRFLARCGGYSWVVTQATLVYDKQKPQSVVCVNYIISGVENEHEIYSCAQLDAKQSTAQIADEKIILKSDVKLSTSSTSSPPPPLPPISSSSSLSSSSSSLSSLSSSPSSLSSNCLKSIETVKSLITEDPPLESIHCQTPKNEPLSPYVNHQQQQQQQQQSVGGIVVAASSSTKIKDNRPRSVTASVFCPVSDIQPSARPQSVTGSLFTSGLAPKVTVKPQSITAKLFAPRKGDMNKHLLKYLDEGTTDITMLKQEPDDLSHLAPTAGDACIPLDESAPLFGEMFDGLILPDGYGSLLQDDVTSLDTQKSKTIDPFINYRDESCDTVSTPNLLSPAGGPKSPYSSGIPSLCSPNSLSQDDEFGFMTMNCDDDIDLTMRAPYIPMNENDDLPLLTEDLMWSAFSDELHRDIRDTVNSGDSIMKESNLASLMINNSIRNESPQHSIDFKKSKFIDKGKIDDIKFEISGETRDNNYKKNNPNLDPWSVNDLLHINNLTANHNKPMAAICPVQVHTTASVRKADRTINKRPINTSLIDINSNKRVKGAITVDPPRSSPQLLQQLMKDSPAPKIRSRHTLNNHNNNNNKSDLSSKWNMKNSTQTQLRPSTDQVSNSVLKNLLETVPMKPPDIILAQDAEKQSNNFSGKIGNDQPPTKLLRTTINNLDPIRNYSGTIRSNQTLPPDATEIPHPSAPNNRAMFRQYNDNCENESHSDQFVNLVTPDIQFISQNSVNFDDVKQELPFTISDESITSSCCGGDLSTQSNKQNNMDDDSKMRKVSFSSLDGDILPIPIQSLLLELSDQDFEMTIPMGSDSLLKDTNTSTIDDWANRLT